MLALIRLALTGLVLYVVWCWYWGAYLWVLDLYAWMRPA